MPSSYTVFLKTHGKTDRIIIEADDHYIDGDILKLRRNASTVAVFVMADIFGFVIGGRYTIPQS